MGYRIPREGQRVRVTLEGVVTGADEDTMRLDTGAYLEFTRESAEPQVEVLPEVYKLGDVAALRTEGNAFKTLFRMKDGSLGEEWYDGNGCMVEVGPSDDLTLIVRADGMPVYRAGES